MRVVLLGGGGFIGSHLAEWLLARGTHDVVVTDINHDKVRHLLDHGRFTYFDSDIHNDVRLTQQLVGVHTVALRIKRHPEAGRNLQDMIADMNARHRARKDVPADKAP